MTTNQTPVIATSMRTENYRPFVSEKELIQTIALQEQEIYTTIKLFQEIIPKNFKMYKVYGEKMMLTGENMRNQLNMQALESKDLFQMLLQLSQFFEIIGRLYSQNYNNIADNTVKQFSEVQSTLKSLKDSHLADLCLKMLPKAQALHQQLEKLKIEYHKSSKDASEAIQKLKQAKNDPTLIYNLSEQQFLEEKASKAVKEMDDKKAKYKQVHDQLQQKNQEFINHLESLTNQHQTLVDQSATSIKKILITSVNTEMLHYDSLNLLTPEKAKIIKNIAIKQDLGIDIKIAEEQSYKIDLQQAKQKVLDLAEGAITHQSMAPFCQYVTDTYEFYVKVAEKWGKYLTALNSFFNEMNISEKNMIKQFKDLNIADKRKKEISFGGFQSAVYETLRSLEIKEKNHSRLGKMIEQCQAKLEQIVKQYKLEEKTFLASIAKVAKDMTLTNEKFGKQTIALEKQITRTTEALANRSKNDTQFAQIVTEYQVQTEILKETYMNFKTLLIFSLEQQLEHVTNYKYLQINTLSQIGSIIQGIAAQEESMLEQQQSLQKDFQSFVEIIDTNNICDQFKCQIMNKHQIEFITNEDKLIDSQESKEENSQNSQNNERGSLKLPRGNKSGGNSLNTSFNANQIDGRSSNIASPNRKSSAESKESSSGSNQKDNKEPFDQMMLDNVSVPNQSFIVKDDNMLEEFKDDQGRSQIIQSRANRKRASKTFIGKQNNPSMISPMKKQLEMLGNHDDILNDNLNKDFQDFKQNSASQIIQESSGANSPNTKFIIDKFNLLEGERYIESYACAISQKILIQGRLYATNKRLCFYSIFNDKTIIFGKETKIVVPFNNISRIEKKTNALVFDNSISIFTKPNDQEIFFTSFVYRDQAFDQIQKLLDQFNGVVPVSRSGSAENEAAVDNRGEVGIENKDEYSQGVGEENEERNEEALEDINEEEGGEEKENAGGNEAQPPPVERIYDNSKIVVDDEFIRVEKDRYEQAKKQMPNIEGYTFASFEGILDCSLKQFAILFLNYNLKWSHLENLSLLEWIDKHILTNINLVFDKKSGLKFPDYFTKPEEPQPSPEVFQEWPLSEQFKLSITHVTEKPKFMQPKTNNCVITATNFFLSPRKIIRVGAVENEGFPYADCFTFDYKLTLEQIDEKRTKAVGECRVNIIKPIRFIQGTVVRETENSLKETYSKNGYFDKINEKIKELKPYHKNLWDQSQPQQQQQQQQQRSGGAKKKSPARRLQQQEELPLNQELFESPAQQQNVEQLSRKISSQILNQEIEIVKHDNEKLLIEILGMRGEISKLVQVMYGLIGLNILLIIIMLFK